MKRKAISKAEHIYIVNEWWRRLRKNPEKFQQQFQAVMESAAAEKAGRAPTLGVRDWLYSNSILDDRAKARRAARAKKAKRKGRVVR